MAKKPDLKAKISKLNSSVSSQPVKPIVTQRKVGKLSDSLLLNTSNTTKPVVQAAVIRGGITRGNKINNLISKFEIEKVWHGIIYPVYLFKQKGPDPSSIKRTDELEQNNKMKPDVESDEKENYSTLHSTLDNNSDAIESSDTGDMSESQKQLGSDGEPDLNIKKSNQRNIKKEVHDSIKVTYDS